MAQSNLMVGAKVVMYINGKPFAKVTGFSWSSSTMRRPLYGIDSSQPYELVPTVTRVAGNVSLLRGIADGGLEGAGVTPNFAFLTREKYFSVTLVERTTDTVLFHATNCSATSQSWDVPARGYVTGQMQFEALTWNNEVTS